MKPSIEVVVKIADTLEVSIDFLVGKTAVELDNTAVKRIQDIQKLDDEDKTTILKTIDALLRDAKARKAYAH